MLYPVPFIPTGMMLIKTFSIFSLPLSEQVCISDHFFLASPLPTYTHLPHALAFDILNHWLIPVYYDVCALETRNIPYQCFFNIGSTTLSFFVASSNIPVYHGQILNSAICACFTKKTALPGRVGIGRLYSPSVPASFVAGNDFTTSAYGRYQAMADQMLVPWTSDAQTFYPVHWSRSANVVYSIDKFSLCKYPRVLRKRRIVFPYNREVPVWPLVT